MAFLDFKLVNPAANYKELQHMHKCQLSLRYRRVWTAGLIYSTYTVVYSLVLFGIFSV